MAGLRKVLVLDAAARAAIGVHEGQGDGRGHVVVQVGLGDPRGRQRGGPALRDDARDARVRHGRLVREEGLVRPDQPLGIEP